MMPLIALILAQAEPSPDFIYKLIAGLSLLANFVLLVSKFRGGGERREITNDPLVVKPSDKFTSQGSFNKHLELDRHEHTKLWDEIAKNRQQHEGEIRDLIEKTSTTAATMERIGEDVREAAKVAREAANTATAALVEAKHKKT